MKLYNLKREQTLPFPLAKVFPFFEKPENLESITPRNLSFSTLTPKPVKMEKGAVIDYAITVWGLSLRWTTLITAFDPPNRFIDLQLKGPYSYWHHEHTFIDQGESTLMKDHVTYALPLGPLGRLAHTLKVRRDLEKIFDFRAEVILNHLKALN